MDAFQELELVGAALQGVLLDFRLWSDAGVEAQALLLEGISSVVSGIRDRAMDNNHQPLFQERGAGGLADRSLKFVVLY